MNDDLEHDQEIIVLQNIIAEQDMQLEALMHSVEVLRRDIAKLRDQARRLSLGINSASSLMYHIQPLASNKSVFVFGTSLIRSSISHVSRLVSGFLTGFVLHVALKRIFSSIRLSSSS